MNGSLFNYSYLKSNSDLHVICVVNLMVQLYVLRGKKKVYLIGTGLGLDKY